MKWVAEQLLTAIAQASPRDCITEVRLLDLTGLNAKAIDHATRKITNRGWLVKNARGCWKLTDAGRAAAAAGARVRSGPQGPCSGKRVWASTVRLHAWRALRIRVKATIPDLIELTAVGGERDITSNLRKYLDALSSAGYVKKLNQRARGLALTSNGHLRYWLVRDTGPKAPVWRQGKCTVWDPNTEEETPCG